MFVQYKRPYQRHSHDRLIGEDALGHKMGQIQLDHFMMMSGFYSNPLWLFSATVTQQGEAAKPKY